MPISFRWAANIFTVMGLFTALLFTGCRSDISETIAQKEFERSGGVELILEIDMNAAIERMADNLQDDLRVKLRQDRIRTEYIRVEHGEIIARVRQAKDYERVLEIAGNLDVPWGQSASFTGQAYRVSETGAKRIRISFTDGYNAFTKSRLTEQSVQIIRKRNVSRNRPRWWATLLPDNQIRVRIPVTEDVDKIKKYIAAGGNLSFHIVRQESNNLATMDLAKRKNVVAPNTAYFRYYGNSNDGLIVERRARITGECLKSASSGRHPFHKAPIINFQFDKYCTKSFRDLTTKHKGERFAVILDSEILTAPRIAHPIERGAGYIEGDFTEESAEYLANLLNSGPLPAKFIIIKETTIKPKQ